MRGNIIRWRYRKARRNVLLALCVAGLGAGLLAPNTHDLAVLFKGISPSTQKRIIGYWDNAIPHHEKQLANLEAMSGQKIPRDLTAALAICGRAFEGMRYIYEDPLKTAFYIIDLAPILHKVIIEIKPEWKDLGPAPAKEIKTGF
jgi:hypothetical protein